MIKLYALTIAALLLLGAGVTAAEPLKAGVAVIDITPPPGYRMAGYYNERPQHGTHDPLLAKAIVFQQGDVQGRRSSSATW